MTRNSVVKSLIIIFPIGLFVLGTGSILFTQFRPEVPENDDNYRKRIEAASLNRKPVSREDLERFVRILSTEIGERNYLAPEGLERAAIWIESTLRGGNLGYQVKRQVFVVDGKEYRNLVVELAGTRRLREIVLVGAPYDSSPGSPGARENASAIASLLSLAQAFAGDPRERTVRFVFFANERSPFYGTSDMGSRFYARALQDKGEDVKVLLNLGSLGSGDSTFGARPDLPEWMADTLSQGAPSFVFTAESGGESWAKLTRNIFADRSEETTIVLQRPDGVAPVAGVDQWSFGDVGFNAVTLTDLGEYRDPVVGTEADTWDKVNFGALENSTRALEAVVARLASP